MTACTIRNPSGWSYDGNRIYTQLDKQVNISNNLTIGNSYENGGIILQNGGNGFFAGNITIGGGVSTSNATSNSCNTGEIKANVTSTTTGKICLCLDNPVTGATWKCAIVS